MNKSVLLVTAIILGTFLQCYNITAELEYCEHGYSEILAKMNSYSCHSKVIIETGILIGYK